MEYSMIVSMSFWITVAILFHLDVFLRGERSWLRSWLSTPGGTGVLAFVVMLTLIPSLLMVIVDFSQVREGQPFFGAGAVWIWLLQGAMLVICFVALSSAISAFKERKPPRVYE
jgi:hypothetical protein